MKIRDIAENRSALISRRDFVSICGTSALAGLLTGCNVIPRRVGKERPNVLFIAIDDLRPELGCYGQSYVVSPNIDRLAREGMIFGHAYCQSAVCNPSRASLMTGLRPDTIKVWDLYADFRDNVPNAVTLPQHFKQHGYHAVAIGKIYHNTIPDQQSWSEPKIYLEGYPFDPDAVYRDKENLEYIENRKQQIVADGKPEKHIDRFGHWYLKARATEMPEVPDNAYYDGAQTDTAIRKLHDLKKRNQPFFFAIGYYRPHLPFNAPKKYWDLYDRDEIPLAENDYLPENAPGMAINNLRELRGYVDFKDTLLPRERGLTESQSRLLKHGYLASVSYIDAQIGRLLDELDRLGLRGKTIVVLWGDHGWKLGEHRSWCKMTNYEIDTRAPLIISSPKIKAKGHLCGSLVEFVDIYPTLCELAGLSAPSHLEGVSMMPLLTDPERPWKKAAFSQFLREGIWKAPDGKVYMGYTVRTNRYRYVQWMNWNTREYTAFELYDHKTDPGENINVVDRSAYASVRKELADLLRKGWEAAQPD